MKYLGSGVILVAVSRRLARLAYGRIADDQDSSSPDAGIPTVGFIFFGRGGCLRVDTLTTQCLQGDCAFQGLTQG